MATILHTEASNGWGGQEIRILKEAEGMRKRGHTLLFAVTKGGKLAERARLAGFTTYEFPLEQRHALSALSQLFKIIRRHKVDIVNTHSSSDGWLGGIAAKLSFTRCIRTRHLSTPIRPGLNSRILYNFLADATVTTCEEVAKKLRDQAGLSKERCLSIPTGVNPSEINLDGNLRQKWGFQETDCVIGTVCVLRSWKGISDLLQAAKILENHENLKWVIVGEGAAEKYFRTQWEALNLQKNVHFIGHLENPYPAFAAMDIFTLLSISNEGVSQATLQAAYLEKPLITTTIGGLPEVCIDGKTGFVVGVKSPQEVATAVLRLSSDKTLRERFGHAAKELVESHFTFDKTLDDMEAVYSRCLA